MKTFINNFVERIRSDKCRNIINKCGIFVILFYYFVGLLSYITVPITPIYRLFVSSSGFAVAIRILLIAIVLIYSILVVIANKEKIKWHWVVIFVSLLFCCLISIIISPSKYELIYQEALYGVVHKKTISPGFTKNLIMYFSSVADFVFAFCILFILPIVINNKKQILYLLLPIVVICLFECLYSIVKEKDIYLYLIQNPNDIFGGYGHEIKATFVSKQDWGAFLGISFTSAFFSLFLLDKHKKNNVVIRIGLVIAALIFAIFSVLSLCKTAMLGIGLSLIVYAICLVVLTYKKNKVLFACFCGLLSAVVLFVTLFFIVPQFHSSGIFKKAYDFVQNLILNRVDTALGGRMSLWLTFVENIRSYNFFFGLGKTNVTAYTSTLQVEGQAMMHNGLFYFLASYGVVGFLILVILFIYVIKNVWSCRKNELGCTFGMIASIVCAISFVLAEAEVFIVSSSNPIFIFNIIGVVLPIGLNLKNQNSAEVINGGIAYEI